MQATTLIPAVYRPIEAARRARFRKRPRCRVLWPCSFLPSSFGTTSRRPRLVLALLALFSSVSAEPWRLVELGTHAPVNAGQGPDDPPNFNLSRNASSECPAQCLDPSIPWWYRDECQACRPHEMTWINERTWTCPPTWPPQRLFIIFSMQRSATQTACYSVDALPNTACRGELLNQGLNPRSGIDPERELRDSFEAMRSASGLAPCTWGFSLLSNPQPDPQLLKWLWDILDASIILERLNGALRWPHSPSFLRPYRLCVSPHGSGQTTRVAEACQGHWLLAQPRILSPNYGQRQSGGRDSTHGKGARVVFDGAFARC